jgi:hypothetical protein
MWEAAVRETVPPSQFHSRYNDTTCMIGTAAAAMTAMKMNIAAKPIPFIIGDLLDQNYRALPCARNYAEQPQEVSSTNCAKLGTLGYFV